MDPYDSLFQNRLNLFPNIFRGFYLAVFLSLGLIFPVWARPPSEILLEYFAERQTLHIKIHHTTNNLREHHIRKLLVYKNDEEPRVYYFVTQTNPNWLIQDVPLKAKPGDVIRVKAICREAGYGEETLVIKKSSLSQIEQTEEKKQEKYDKMNKEERGKEKETKRKSYY